MKVHRKDKEVERLILKKAEIVKKVRVANHVFIKAEERLIEVYKTWVIKKTMYLELVEKFDKLNNEIKLKQKGGAA